MLRRSSSALERVSSENESKLTILPSLRLREVVAAEVRMGKRVSYRRKGCPCKQA